MKRPCFSGQGRGGSRLVPAEFSAWLSERHSDFHDALINGGPAVREAERLVEMTGRTLLLTMIVISACRTVTMWGLHGVRDQTQFPRAQRRRTLLRGERSMDSDGEDDRPWVSTSGLEVFAMSDREDSIVEEQMPGALCQMGGPDKPTLQGLWWKAIGVASTVVGRHHVRQIF